MSGNITLSPKHGVNPSLVLCPCCGEDLNMIALNGRMKGDEEAPKYMVDTEPCQACKLKFDDFKKLGFVLFIIRDEYEDRTSKGDNLPTWPFFHAVHVIDHDAARRIFVGLDFAAGCAFISQSLAKRVGLPTEVNEPL